MVVPTVTAPNRRWFQFRLRTFLVLMVAVGAVLGLGVREALRRREDELDRQQTKQALQDAWLRNDKVPTRACQSDQPPMISAPNRRWLRFSLRTLFVVVTVIACWLGWNLHQVRERDRLLESRDFLRALEFPTGYVDTPGTRAYVMRP